MSETSAPHLRAFAALVFLLSTASMVIGFQSPSIRIKPQPHGRMIHSFMTKDGSMPSLMEKAAELKAQAERMRLEAERQDAALTLSKIESLEEKLANKKWLAKHPDEEPQLIQQVKDLTNRLRGEKINSGAIAASPTASFGSKIDTVTSESKPSLIKTSSDNNNLLVPEYGFSQKDLDLYLPVAKEIEDRMGNATIEEKLAAFRETPELANFFQSKIEELFLGPLKNFQRLEYLKTEYMKSTSSVEKNQLRREMQQLEDSVDENSLLVCDTIYKELPALTEDYVESRVKAISSLPPVLVAFYKRKSNVGLEDDLRFAIELDHYDPQLQLLYEIDSSSPLTQDQLADAMRAFASLSPRVKDRFAQELGLENGKDASAVLKKLEGKNAGFPNGITINIPDTEVMADLDFQDRSRWVEELLPSLADLEDFAPSEEEMDMFYAQVLDRKTFAPSTKPERVRGGYYVRGQNYFQSEGANDKLMDALRRKLDASPLAGKIQAFYIFDPSPATDEQIEFGDDFRPVLFVAGGSLNDMYKPAKTLTKGLVSLSSLVFMVVFALGAYGVNENVVDQVQAAINVGEDSLSILLQLVSPIVPSLVAIQLAHEVAHRIVAWKDKFEVGWPTFVPSIQLGLTGAITPLKSPPKNSRSLFDFAIAGPLAGIIVSLLLLGTGLGVTATVDLSQQALLPLMPVQLIRSSALVGAMVESFLGSGALLSPNPEVAFLPLHPFAIAGIAGIFSNALSLLPLGNTDGGRIALAMFGRRGAYIVKTCTTLLAVAVGLFGLDESHLVLLYVMFTSVWQRELESPSLNEIDELDLTRGLVAISAALLVALTLVPML